MKESTPNEIIRLHYRGASQRRIAKLLGVARKSVARVLSAARFSIPPGLGDDPEFHPLRNLAEGGVQRIGNFPEAAYRWIDNAPFDAADVGPIKSAVCAEAFLREAGLIAEFAHNDADSSCLQIGWLDLPLKPLHGQI